MKYVSLKTKMALAISALFIIFSSLISYATLSYFEAEFRNTLAKEQFSLLSSIAADIEEKMSIAHNILIASADSVPLGIDTDPDKAQGYLDAQKGLLSIFDNGLFLLSKEGMLIAESPYRPERRGRDIRFRDFYQHTVATKKPYISKPYFSTHNPGEPALAMTVPILDSRGEVVVILQGSFDLLGTNIFADLLKVRNGQTGYLYLCDKDLMMIVHPNKERVLKPGQKRGANIMLDRAVDGFEGSGETVTSFGGKMFVTFKQVNPTGWILGSNYPMPEAYAPFYRARTYFIMGIIATTSLVLFLVWVLMKRFTNPLLTITRHVKTLANDLENYRPLGINSSDEIGALGKAFDSMATALAVKEMKLQENELNFRALAENASDGMLIADKDGTIVYVNERIAEITEYESSKLLGLHIERLVTPEKLPMISDILAAVLNGKKAGNFETVLLRKDQTQLPVEVSIALTYWAGKMAGLLVVRDISERKTAEEQIEFLAYHDALTALPNRRLLLDRLQQALASSARSGRKGALFFLDLDNFKTLNDTLGHDTGDLLLEHVAQRLTTCVREGDTVARLGGDEFVVMLEDLSEHPEEAATQAETLGEKILAALNQPYRLAGYEKHSTPSIGVTLFSGHQNSIEELLKQADLAMYQSKMAGRNTLRFFDPKMQALVTERAALEADLSEAVKQQQFVLYYQPQVVGEGRLTGAEALVRWQHPQRGLVSPAEFIPLAEETGLILPLGLWVLETACAQLAQWAAQPSTAHLTLAVNISAKQLHQTDFVDQVLAVLDRTGANPHRLKLELTESLLVSNVEISIAKMVALKAHGVGFSMDDFGTGYSSLSSLKRLPLDQLKIDQGFVRDILTDANDAAIAKMVIALAESLGLTVIAEGVEIEAQRDFLARQGCHSHQGYLFSRPLPLDEFESFVRRG